VDPSKLAAGVDLLVESAREAVVAAAEIRLGYVELLKRVFDYDVYPDDVSCCFGTWELAWDRLCPTALHAPTAYEYAWRTVLPFAMRSWGDDRATYVELSDDPSEADISAGGPGYLRGRTKKGCAAKLYGKKPWLLRFEAVLSLETIRRTLGHAPRFERAADLEADLRALARRFYETILRVQAVLTCPTILDVEALTLGFARVGKSDRGLEIMRAFRLDGRFKHVGETHYRELRALRERGWALVVQRRHGIWAPTPVVARSLYMLSVTARRTESCAHDAGLR
jgi:hypothetical protein